MPEEFLWDINWDELPEEAPSKAAASSTAPSAKPPAASTAAAPASAPQPRASVASGSPVAPVVAPQAATKPPPLPPAPPAPTVAAPAPVQTAAPAAEKKTLVRGQRIDLATLGRADLVLDVVVRLSASGASLCCLGLMENDRFVADDYFVFENQPGTPCGSCRLEPEGRQTKLHLDLTRAPKPLHRFLVAVYTDAQRGVGAHGAGVIQVRHGTTPVAEGSISASDLGSGPCALLAEIYRRGSGWRLGVLLVGTGGSLESLLRSHGAEVQ